MNHSAGTVAYPCGRARVLAPARPISRLRVEQRHRMVPKTDVDADILENRTNRAGATAATGCGAPWEAPGDEIFLYDVIGQPQRVAEVRVTARAQQLIRAHRHMARGLGIPHVKRRD